MPGPAAARQGRPPAAVLAALPGRSALLGVRLAGPGLSELGAGARAAAPSPQLRGLGVVGRRNALVTPTRRVAGER